jgi:hypothetical protein
MKRNRSVRFGRGRTVDRPRSRLTLARLGIVVMLVAAALAGSLSLDQRPAKAGLFDGDLVNNLPSSIGVTVARFGTGGTPFCEVWNAPDHSCTRFGVPSGQTDSIWGSTFDVDGFAINREYVVHEITTNLTFTVGAGRWTKIPGLSDVTCELRNNRPWCIATWIDP